ncbi:transmembrane protein EpsG [Dokdonia sp. Hel_I_63]|uniref:EpsG family protein n=1 Tax=Dokdonia sp. Hel_I_63 TaxID=1249996 RepID=UPI00119AB4F9|nr:EpsG family protein [Dokdonia sp. Hel_I_63]TVZ23000.1 transmembrane protein EpsG [Dokdonia sp. Hel_I_63]
MIRLFVIIIILAAAFYFSTSSSKFSYDIRRKRYVAFMVFVLAMQSGLRNWAVGSDTYQYNYLWRQAQRFSWDSTLERLFTFSGKDPFYLFFQKVIQIFILDYQVYLMIVGFFFMIPFGHFIYKNTTSIRHIAVAFIIYMGYYYGFYSITGIRQTLATAVLFISYEHLVKRNIWRFISLVLFASLFHISALVFLPLYAVVRLNMPRLIFGLSIITFPIVMYFKNYLALFFVTIFGVEDRFGAYAEQYKTGGSLILTAFQIVLGIIGLILMKKATKDNYRVVVMYNVFALALFFLPLQWVNPSAGRVAQYFAIIMMVWIPFLLDASSSSSLHSNKFRGVTYSLATVGFIFITIFAIQSLDEYKFFWQYMKAPYGS